MTNPRVWPWITDDYCGSPEDFAPVNHPSMWYVLARDGSTLLGLWLFIQDTHRAWIVHTCLLPKHGFRRAREAALELTRWIWANTPCRRIITQVPVCNRMALKFALDVGFKQFGVDEASFDKNGRVWDRIYLGITCHSE
jgi:RimJ/RimL family protein N-acetyltransferase